MYHGMEKWMMHLRMQAKREENALKPPLDKKDVVQTSDFVFSPKPDSNGDSGRLLLAKRKSNRQEQYLVKHEFTDCACNEYIYTKLAQAMGYSMPDAVLFQFSDGEKRSCFQTEYIIGERLLNVVAAQPSFQKIRERAKNWTDYFGFCGLYEITGESDGIEILLADDGKIYRVDTTDAFPLDYYQLNLAGIRQEVGGVNPWETIKKALLSQTFTNVLHTDLCDRRLEQCQALDGACRTFFLEPFARLQEIPASDIDDFLNTLCYFYPDYIGDYFKRYLSALQKQCRVYLMGKRSF